MPRKSKDSNGWLGNFVNCSAAGEHYKAFLPPPLPPNPPLEMDALQKNLLAAVEAMGRLNVVSAMLPDVHLLLYYYLRKEAVLSAQIEGTQSSLSDLLQFESREKPAVPIEDVQEVSAYVAALQYGLDRLRSGFPLSLRLIREIHQVLLRSGRGHGKQPGMFRRSQNWLGGTRPGNAMYVPPPPERLMECLDAFEKYLHLNDSAYPTLINAGLIHAQFETIHPFLDGNGRVGRLLITLYLSITGDLPQPWFYLSLYFKNNRFEYYDRLNAVRTQGDWEGWLQFFLTGVAETASQVLDTSLHIQQLLQSDHQKITSLKRAGIRARAALTILHAKPIISATDMAVQMNSTVQTARAALSDLLTLGIVSDIAGSGKERLYVYTAFLDILSKGTAPINYNERQLK